MLAEFFYIVSIFISPYYEAGTFAKLQPAYNFPESFLAISNEQKIINDSIKKQYLLLWSNGFFSMTKATYKDWQRSGENYFACLLELEPYFKSNTSDLFQEQKISLKYGFIKNKGQRLHKHEDEIYYRSTFKRHLTKDITLDLQAKFTTQLGKTYLPTLNDQGKEEFILHSSFLSPAYIIGSTGFSYKPYTSLSLSAGLASTKLSIVRNQSLYHQAEDDVIFNVPRNENHVWEYGFAAYIEFKKELFKNIEVQNELNLFINKDHFKSIDIDSKSSLSLKLNKHIKTMLSHHLLYDEDILNRSQVQQQIMLGYYF